MGAIEGAVGKRAGSEEAIHSPTSGMGVARSA
jgi:hypothetical protein